MTANQEFTTHTCNPRNPGKPLPFGRKAPEGECVRCDELRAGAPPREAHPAIQAAARRRAFDAENAQAQRTHDCVKSRCYRNGFGTIICTAFES